MKTKSGTVRAIVAAVMVALVTLSSPSSVVGGPKVADFEIRVGEKQTRLSDARGRFAVIQYLPSLDAPGASDYVQALTRRSIALADLVPVFVFPANEAAISAFRAKQTGASQELRLGADVDGTIAKSLGLSNSSTNSPSAPATIIVDPAGMEALRRIGKSTDDYMPIQDIISFVESRSVAADVAQFNLKKGEPALQGYDPVAYFESAGPMKGRSEWTTQYRGVRYQFADESNLRKFVADPERYRPTYGGWCATAMADGRKVEIAPTNFKITQGRLFLFYKGWLGNARNDWDKKEAELTRLADENWRRIAPSDQPSQGN